MNLLPTRQRGLILQSKIGTFARNLPGDPANILNYCISFPPQTKPRLAGTASNRENHNIRNSTMSELSAFGPIIVIVYLAMIVYGLFLSTRFVKAVEKIAEAMKK